MARTQHTAGWHCICQYFYFLGVKLDSKSCEALEAVFKRVRFEVIDFENCGLEEEVRKKKF